MVMVVVENEAEEEVEVKAEAEDVKVEETMNNVPSMAAFIYGRTFLTTSLVPVGTVVEAEAEVVVVVVENNMISSNHTIHNSTHIYHHRRFKGVLVYHLRQWHQ